MAELNPEQNLAAQHVEGPLLVLAGAGSGKTRVVTHRIAHLVDIGVPSSDILAVTFTNKAAEEMKNRIRQLKNVQVLACTFHSLGVRILRESGSHLGYGADFVIYDEEDSEKLLKECLDSSNRSEASKIRHQISTAKNNLIDPENADKEFSQSYLLYQQKLKECNALDFDDLLYLTVKLLIQSAEIREMYQKRWQFVLIDEYQDTNMAQYTLAKILVAEHQNIFAVGDPDQSIYSWRGARYQNILRFEEDFPGAKVITLDQNYRSTNTILSAANALIEHNSDRYEKKLWSAIGEGSKIGVFTGQNEKEEARFVAKMIVHHMVDYPLDEIAVFYRTNAQSRVFEDALLSQRIDYQIIGGLSFYQRREVKDILAFLRVLFSDSDLISFFRTINLPKRGLGASTLEKIVEASHGAPMIPFCESLLHDFTLKLGNKQREGLKDYLKTVHELRALQHQIPLHQLISEVVHRFNYLKHLQEDPETEQDRKENVEELIGKAAEWEEENPGMGLSKFLEELSLRMNVEEKKFVPSVKLMTLHNSKGLEFPLVFVVGLEEDLLPHVNSRDDDEAIEEERRLFYVGMTRAKRQLYLCSTVYRFMWGTARFMRASRFLKEIPAKFLHNYASHTLHREESIPSSAEHYDTGDQVMHKEFGVGTVQRAYQGTFGLTLEVYFPSAGACRTLVAKYAKLQSYPG